MTKELKEEYCQLKKEHHVMKCLLEQAIDIIGLVEASCPTSAWRDTWLENAKRITGTRE